MEEGRLKSYRDRVKQYDQNKRFQNSKRKFYQQVDGHCIKTNQVSDAKEIKQFWRKIWRKKEHNGNAKWVNNMKKEFEELEEGPEANIYQN